MEQPMGKKQKTAITPTREENYPEWYPYAWLEVYQEAVQQVNIKIKRIGKPDFCKCNLL